MFYALIHVQPVHQLQFATPAIQQQIYTMAVAWLPVLLGIMHSMVNVWFALLPYFANHVPIAIPVHPAFQDITTTTETAIRPAQLI